MSNVVGQPQPVVGASNDTWGDNLNAVDTALGDYAVRLQLFSNISSGDGTYVVLMDSRWAYAIKRATVKTADTGVATVAVKINGTAVTGLSALNATTTKSSVNATALNTGVQGSDISIVVSGNTADFVYVTLYVDRTSAGAV
jgi:hypothetical protein